MEENTLSRELGKFDAEIMQLKLERAELRSEIKDIKEELKEVVRILTQAQGGWKTLVIISTVAATLGGIIATLIGFVI